MSTKNRTFNTTRSTRRLLGLLTGLAVWHLMSRLAWAILAYKEAKSYGSYNLYLHTYLTDEHDHDASWWDYFIGYTSKFGDILSSHYYGYSLAVLACIVIGVVALVVSWIFESDKATNKSSGNTNTSFYAAAIGIIVGMSASPGWFTLALAFM